MGGVAESRSYILQGSLTQDVLVTKHQRVLQSGPRHSKLTAPIRRRQDTVMESVS